MQADSSPLTENSWTLNNREMAIAIWLAVLLAWVLSHRGTRESIPGLLKAAFHWKLTACWIAVALYALLAALSLEGWGLWSVDNLKATLLWVVTAGLVMVFRVASEQPDRQRLWQSSIGGLKISIVLEFIANVYVFPLLIELVAVPLLAALTALAAFAEIREEHKQAKGCFNGLLSIAGLTLLGYGVYRIWADFEHFAQFSTLVDFLLPILLTVFFLPFLFVLVVVAAYETVFVQLKIFMHDDALRRFTRWELVRQCGWNFERAARWRKRYMLERPSTREAVRASISRRSDSE